MEQGMDFWEFAGIAILAVIWIIFSLRGANQWEADISKDFQAALKNLHIVSYELLVDRTVAPSSNTHAEVYRILRGQDGRYFLYMLLDDAKGVMKSLSEERALIAARMSGYQK